MSFRWWGVKPIRIEGHWIRSMSTRRRKLSQDWWAWLELVRGSRGMEWLPLTGVCSGGNSIGSVLFIMNNFTPPFRLPPTPISLSHPAPLENQVVAWSQSIWISVSFHGSSILIVHSVQKSPIGNIPNEITLNGVFANVSVYDSLLSRNKKILD